MDRTGTARREGELRAGSGSLRLGTGAFEGPYSSSARWERAPGTGGHPPTRLETSGHLEPVGADWAVIGVARAVTGEVPGITAAALHRHAESAKANGIMAKLVSVPLTLRASLAH